VNAVNAVAAAEEGGTVGVGIEEMTDIEVLIVLVEEGLIGGAPDILDHHRHVGATPEIGVLSGPLYQGNPIHMFPVAVVEGDGGPLLLNQYLPYLHGLGRTRALHHLADEPDHPRDLALHLADADLDLETGVAPIEVEAAEEEEEVQIVELDEGPQHLQILPSLALHVRQDEEDLPLSPSVLRHPRDLVDLVDVTLAPGLDLSRAPDHEAALPVEGCLAVGKELGPHQHQRMILMPLRHDLTLVGVMNVTNVG